MRLALIALAASRLRAGRGGAEQDPNDLFGGMFGPLQAEEEAAEAVVVDQERVLDEKKDAVKEAEEELEAAEPEEKVEAQEVLADAEEDVDAAAEVIKEAEGMADAANEQAKMVAETQKAKEDLLKKLGEQVESTDFKSVNETVSQTITETEYTPIQACLARVRELDKELDALLRQPGGVAVANGTQLTIASLPGERTSQIHWPLQPTLDRFGVFSPAAENTETPLPPVEQSLAQQSECAALAAAVRRKYGVA